jgi:Rieske Fe-S protein
VPGDPELPDAPAVPVALSDVPEGRRMHVQWGQVPVELQRSGTSIQARALLCTHQGCRITWDEDRACYRCACHDGRFDAAGRPIAGIPNRPLFRVPLLVSATTVYVGARA